MANGLVIRNTKAVTPLSSTLDLHSTLVRQSMDGDRLAQYQLYQLYSKAMFNICYRMMNSREEAEDMLQEAFADAFASLHRFRGDSTFGAWLKRIVINKCINELKRRKVDLELRDDIGRFEGAHEDTSHHKDLQLEVARVMEAVKQLPDGYRVIFSLYLLEGYDHREIAEILEITESTSKSQYMRAKKKIKQLLTGS